MALVENLIVSLENTVLCRTAKSAILRGLLLPQWDPPNFYVSSGNR